MELLEGNAIPAVSVDVSQTEPLLRLLDTAVIRLEGGTEEDLKVLDEKPVEITARPIPVEVKKPASNDDLPNNEEETKKADESIDKVVDKEDENNGEEEKKEPEKDETVANGSNKRKRSRSGSSSSSSSSSSDDDEKVAEKPPKSPEPEDEPMEEVTEEPKDAEKEEDESKKEEESVESMKDDDEEKEKEDKETPLEDGEEKDTSVTEVKERAAEPEIVDLDKEKDVEEGPRALHRTSSIFLRNLAPTITKAEVEAMCKRFDGFLRVAIADPLVERRWFRRGWVTFKRDVNIKEICWNLNNIRVRIQKIIEMSLVFNECLCSSFVNVKWVRL